MVIKSAKPKVRNRPTVRKPENRLLKPVSPGELLEEEFLIPMEISAYRLAKEIEVPATRISEILRGARAITADTDLRLAKFFGLSNGYWLRAQAAYDLEIARANIAKELLRIKPWSHPLGKSGKK